ncbi:MAG: hypothetical protein HW382_478 [Deltaproteobacteria bacterium]|nr:hypothetical protein [Deltaproteobacteria bacterium]MBM2837993.1 hypothetical protein [Deltaproteobacteria bacterium]
MQDGGPGDDRADGYFGKVTTKCGNDPESLALYLYNINSIQSLSAVLLVPVV